MSTSGTQAAIGLIGLADQRLPMTIATAEADYSLHVWAGRPGALDALGHVGHIRALAEHGPQPRTSNNKTSPQLDGNRSTSASTKDEHLGQRLRPTSGLLLRSRQEPEQ